MKRNRPWGYGKSKRCPNRNGDWNVRTWWLLSWKDPEFLSRCRSSQLLAISCQKEREKSHANNGPFLFIIYETDPLSTHEVSIALSQVWYWSVSVLTWATSINTRCTATLWRPKQTGSGRPETLLDTFLADFTTLAAIMWCSLRLSNYSSDMKFMRSL